MSEEYFKIKKANEKATAPAVAFIVFFLITCWSCTCAADVQAFLEIEAKG